MTPGLDDPGRALEIRRLILHKRFLRRYYEEIYARYRECLGRCPPEGGVLELGAGAGFAKDRIEGLRAVDVLAYPFLDAVMDARRLAVADASLRLICMFNVFHHISDVEAFLEEVQRCLRPGGRLLVVDQHPGWIGRVIYQYLHHEEFHPAAPEWKFESTGPLSGANGALAWIVFCRDRSRLAARFPRLRRLSYTPHTPLRYWLSGGLKRWSLLPGWAFPLATRIDRFLTRASSQLGSFVDIEVVRTE